MDGEQCEPKVLDDDGLYRTLYFNICQIDATVGEAGIQFTAEGCKGCLFHRYIKMVIGVSQLTEAKQRQLWARHIPDRIPIPGFAEDDARLKCKKAGVGAKGIQLISEFVQLSLQFLGKAKDIEALHKASIAKRERLYKGKNRKDSPFVFTQKPLSGNLAKVEVFYAMTLCYCSRTCMCPYKESHDFDRPESAQKRIIMTRWI